MFKQAPNRKLLYNTTNICLPPATTGSRDPEHWIKVAVTEDLTVRYRPKRIDEAGRYFDDTVQHIQVKEFEVKQVPETMICRECDLRFLCNVERIT